MVSHVSRNLKAANIIDFYWIRLWKSSILLSVLINESWRLFMFFILRSINIITNSLHIRIM